LIRWGARPNSNINGDGVVNVKDIALVAGNLKAARISLLFLARAKVCKDPGTCLALFPIDITEQTALTMLGHRVERSLLLLDLRLLCDRR